MGLALLVAGIADEAGPIAVVTTAVAAVLGFAGLLVRQLIQQQSGWQVLVAAAEQRAAASDTRTVVAEAEVDAVTSRARACEAQLSAATQVAQAAQDRAIAAEQRAVAAEGRADLLSLQLDEVRRRLYRLEHQEDPHD